MIKLLRQPSFALFFYARSISVVGSAISFVALPLYIYQKTDSPILVSLVTSITVIPYLAFGAVAGAMGDRLNRRRLLVTCDAVSAASMAIIPIAAAANLAVVWAIYVGAACSAAASVWFDAGTFGAVPALAGRANITEANSLLWVTSSVSSALAPALGGLLASGIGAPDAVALDAASFAFSALLLSRIAAQLGPGTPSATSEGSPVRQVARDMIEGFAYLWNHRLIRALTFLGTANALTGGALVALIVVYATRGLHVPDHGLAIGFLYAADGTGAAVGGFLLPRVTRRFRATRVTVPALCSVAIFVILVALNTQYALGLVLVCFWSVSDTMVILNTVSIRQLIVPDNMQSRVNTTGRMLAMGGMPVGAAIGGMLAEYFAINVTLLLCSLPAICAVAAGCIVRLGKYEVDENTSIEMTAESKGAAR